MEVEDIHASKRSRMGNGGLGDVGPNVDSGTASTARVGPQQHADEEEDGEGRSFDARGGGGSGGVRGLRPWQQPSTASRIYRVSRASGGKDRHSKVMTAKGLRDRRVRLSVSTAIQFYDLQDRLGYDQPSKAIEWLIKAAAAAISELPALDGAFPDQPPPSERQQVKPAGEADEDEEDDSQLQYANHHHLQLEQEEHQSQQRPQQQQRLSLTKSTCSSTSETSKGSVLSLSRSEIRVKARERARERTATAKDKEDMEDDAHVPSAAAHHKGVNPNPITSQSSFTELLTGGGHQNHHIPLTVAQANPSHDFIHKHLRQQPTSATAATTTDYFGQVGLGTGQKTQQPSSIFPAQTHFGNSSQMGMVPFNVSAAVTSGDQPEMQQQQQHYMQEHLFPFAVTAAGGDYINFSISSGFNRGTLQSNSPSPLLHHHLQMFSSPVDGSNMPFFLGAAAAQAASASGESQLHTGFDSRLQLCYRHPDQLKGKGKN
ncbi:hypothetical protein Taro_030875 [Colocasia esculenta]|uniref:Transcription factor TCP2 n=1 Tax=Colocasia esculenta TaxID=4460 RepID=A0A843VHH3_COLES|nr:hypothetical protein [Colocasia esculenta]